VNPEATVLADYFTVFVLSLPCEHGRIVTIIHKVVCGIEADAVTSALHRNFYNLLFGKPLETTSHHVFWGKLCLQLTILRSLLKWVAWVYQAL
jgi:hypothetical protein